LTQKYDQCWLESCGSCNNILLVLIYQQDNVPISNILEYYGRHCEFVFPDTKLLNILELFKTGRAHLAIVHDVVDAGDGDPFYANVGIVTMEDVIETIIHDEIADELDAGKKKKVALPAPASVLNLVLTMPQRIPLNRTAFIDCTCTTRRQLESSRP